MFKFQDFNYKVMTDEDEVIGKAIYRFAHLNENRWEYIESKLTLRKMLAGYPELTMTVAKRVNKFPDFKWAPDMLKIIKINGFKYSLIKNPNDVLTRGCMYRCTGWRKDHWENLEYGNVGKCLAESGLGNSAFLVACPLNKYPNFK